MPSAAIATTTVTFKNDSGSVIDPTTIFLKFRSKGSGWTIKSYPTDITRSSIGVYTYAISCDVAGEWLVEWHGETTSLQKDIRTAFQVPE